MAERGRTAGFRMGSEHRSKIANSRIFSNLLKAAEGELELTDQQERISLALLKKVMPDVQATAFTDTDGNDLPTSVKLEIVRAPNT